MIGKRKMRRAITERFADRNAFGIQRIVDVPHGCLGALVMNIPGVEMGEGGPRSSGSAAGE